jgi:hypothetical protein
MKKYLYIVVPLAKWFANTLIMIGIFSFVFPVPIAPWVDLIIGWTLSAFIAAPFAHWAFKKQIPTDKELGIFILAWVAVTVVMESVMALIYYPNPFTILVRYEFLVQTILEIAAILIIARVMRRQNAYHMAAPGIDLDQTDIA